MTTPEPVSPAPDTEALRQQVEEALKERWLDDESERGRATPEGLADAVLALPWIKYAAGQRHVVTMHERNNAAIAETNRQFAEENAGLRADLDRARAEVERLKREGSPGVMHKIDQAFHELAIKERDLERARVDRLDGALRSTQQGLIRMEQQRDALRVAICRAAGVDPDQISEVDTDYEAMCAELARASGDRPTPDDAAVDVVARRLFQAHVSNSYGAVRAERMWNITLDDTDRDFWRNHAREALAEAGLSTPATDPAPAAAASTHEEWAVWYGGPDPYNAAGIESYDDEDDARANLQWYRSDLGSGIAVRTVTRSTWRVVEPAAPQAPAGPPATPHGLIDATHVVTLWGSTRCTGCNAVDEYWCSCPDGYTPDGPDPAGPLVDVGSCSCRPTAVVIHQSGTYCGDAQYEQAVDAMRAAVGRGGDERDEEAVHAVLDHLANPTPEEER